MAVEIANGPPPARGEGSYPAQLSVDYPESSNRLTALVRLILAIPIFVVATFMSGAFTTGYPAVDEWIVPITTGGTLWIAPLLMIVFRQKYPRWWFDWNLEFSRFNTRLLVYVLLLRDEYPSTDEQQAVSLQIEYPDGKGELNRYLPVIKWLLAIPHIIVLVLLCIAVLIVTFIAWLAILIAGRYPRGLFTFVEGTLRWGLGVYAYAFILTTDRYPPFRLGP